VPQKNGMDVKGTVVQWSMVVVVLRVLFFVLINPLIEKCIVCSICHRETIDERGVQSKRKSNAKSGACQRGAVGSLQKQQRLRQQSNALLIPGTICVNRGEQCLRQREINVATNKCVQELKRPC